MTLLGALLFGLRVIAPLLIAYALLQRGLRRGTVTTECFERRVEWLRTVAFVGAVAFGALGLTFLLLQVVNHG